MVAMTPTLGLCRRRRAVRVGVRRHIPPVIFLAALIVLIVAMARPQATVSLPRLEGSVILAFDVSGSMAADDLKPSRIEAAKVAAREFVQDQPSSVQIGVVTFSDGGFTRSHLPTTRCWLAAINPSWCTRGTSMARGIEASLNVSRRIKTPASPGPLSSPHARPRPPTPSPCRRAPILPPLSSCSRTVRTTRSTDPLELAQTAADRASASTRSGWVAPGGRRCTSKALTLRSRLDEETLQEISQVTGGTYYNAENERRPARHLDNLDPQLAVKPQKME